MTDYTKLVAALRHCSGDRNCQECEYDTTLHCTDHLKADAAGAIEALQAEVTKRDEIVRCRECRWVHICRIGQHLGLDGFCSKGEREVQDER